MTTVAILGGQGQIARSLIAHLPETWRVVLFSRDPARANVEAAARGLQVLPYAAFAGGEYDLVINAAGPGDPGVHRMIGREIFRITEFFDNLVLDYVSTRKECGYIFISTGAIFGPAYDARGFTIERGELDKVSPYVLAKLAAEAKHRQSPDLCIADLRVFGYFSRQIELTSQFFLAQAVLHAREGRVFRTGPADFIRDFVAPEDLAAQIVALQQQGVPNAGYNALSARPATKFDLLDSLGHELGLKYEVKSGQAQRLEPPNSVTPPAGRVNILPASQLTSMQLVLREASVLCERAKPRIDVSFYGNS